MAEPSNEQPGADAARPEEPAREAGSPAPQASGRFRQSARDMLLSLAVLVVLIGLVALLTRGCEFSPGGPSVDPSAVPSVDAARELAAAARRVDFPVRKPELPAGWRSNSSNTVSVEGDTSQAVRVGWITDRGNYLRLSQSRARPEPLVTMESGGAAAEHRGEVDVSGTKWTIYPGRGREPAWLARFDGVTVLITGSGDEREFRVLAEAVRAAPPLPR